MEFLIVFGARLNQLLYCGLSDVLCRYMRLQFRLCLLCLAVTGDQDRLSPWVGATGICFASAAALRTGRFDVVAVVIGVRRGNDFRAVACRALRGGLRQGGAGLPASPSAIIEWGSVGVLIVISTTYRPTHCGKSSLKRRALIPACLLYRRMCRARMDEGSVGSAFRAEPRASAPHLYSIRTRKNMPMPFNSTIEHFCPSGNTSSVLIYGHNCNGGLFRLVPDCIHRQASIRSNEQIGYYRRPTQPFPLGKLSILLISHYLSPSMIASIAASSLFSNK
ncbi:hypothetical protein FBPa45_0100 [Pseudomonas phage vB_PaeS_FBPa45]|nr:hypothetical protein FBPa45_0100 [Pseudomonas phage vB_PaeS_FBPa45]